MTRESVMGSPQAARIKTDVRMPPELNAAVEEICEVLGTPKNAFFALAAAQFVGHLSPVLRVKKSREQIIAAVEEIFQGIVQRLRK